MALLIKTWALALGSCPLLPARLPSPSWWHRYTPAEPAAGTLLLTPATGLLLKANLLLAGEAACSPSLSLLPEESVTEEWEARIPLQGRGVGSALCSALVPLQVAHSWEADWANRFWAPFGLVWGLLIGPLPSREEKGVFQDCRLRGTGQGVDGEMDSAGPSAVTFGPGSSCWVEARPSSEESWGSTSRESTSEHTRLPPTQQCRPLLGALLLWGWSS